MTSVPVCPTHKKEMKSGRNGFYCPTPIQKSPDGKTVLAWCQYNPSEDTPVPQKLVESREPVDRSVWEQKDLRIAREAALHAVSRNHMGKEVSPLNMVEEADVLVNYICNGLPEGRTIEDLSDEELDSIANGDESPV